MSAEPVPAGEEGPARRGRPRARNEIVRAGTVAGVDPETLATRFGTPLYVYDLDVVERQVRSLADALPPSVDLAYAVKANPALGVVAHIASLGLGADVASGGELEAALAAGVPPERIVFTGPGKRGDELRLAVRAGIRAVTVESLGELERLALIAAAENRRVRILLRAAVSPEARLERVRLVGDDGAGKFGLGADELRRAAERAIRSTDLELLGLHAFGASNVLDAAALADHVAITVAMAARIAHDVGFPLRLVDVGGGIGIPYEAHEESFDLVGFGRRLAELAAGWADDPALRGVRLLLEPGRFLVGPAGAYLTRVVDRKTLDGREVVIVDGGIHHLVRPALVGQEHRVRRFKRPSSGPARFSPVTIAGPLCSGLDVLATEAMIRTPEVGDLVAVLDVGAYGFTESMPFFLSHPLPAEVAVRGGEAALLRPRLEPSTVLGWQRLPVWTKDAVG
ncbi:MAG TPA: diaminopimelate decarboxylase [Candidatus Limnocylindrales bacterium]